VSDSPLITLTKSGTKIIKDIEFNEDPPRCLKRATTKKWAKALIETGSVRMNSMEYLREIEDPQRGDKNEGKGLFRLKGHPMTVETINRVFAFCTADFSTKNQDLLDIANENDTIVVISNILEFAERIKRASRGKGPYWTHCGHVKYNYGSEITKDALNDQKWNWNIFQKDMAYSLQKEYRFTISFQKFPAIEDEYLLLEVGFCGDIILMIEE
jgi:hypothetical protein